MKAVVAAFNQEKALVGAFSVIVQPVVEPMEHYTALLHTLSSTCVQSEREQYQQQVSGARSKEKLRTSAESQVGVLYCIVLYFTILCTVYSVCSGHVQRGHQEGHRGEGQEDRHAGEQPQVKVVSPSPL